MAHENIYERRKAVESRLPCISNADIKEISIEFGCSVTAVRADVLQLRKNNGLPIFTSAKRRRIVRDRDEDICQYCFTKTKKPVVDHVIPTHWGGPGLEYNLVVSCQPCNQLKRNAVWVPNNIATLRELNPDWAEKIEQYGGKPFKITINDIV